MHRVSDLASSSIYYMHYNSGWTGDNDMLTQALNATAQHLAQGDALSYNWLNAGWTREKMGEKAFGDLARYAGYLKCYYTAGMLGGVAGYFAYPKGGFDGDISETPPHWLAQMTALTAWRRSLSSREGPPARSPPLGLPQWSEGLVTTRWPVPHPLAPSPQGERGVGDMGAGALGQPRGGCQSSTSPRKIGGGGGARIAHL